MKKYAILLLPALLFSDDLKTILDFANKNNTLIQATKLNEDAKAQDIKTKTNALFPTIDIGGSYQKVKELSVVQPGDIYTVYAKFGYDIYDGGKKSSLINSAKNEYEASKFTTNATKQNLNLNIIQDFYLIKNTKASLDAEQEANKSLKEQLNRIKKYFEAGLATKSDIDRLQASYDANNYSIETIKLKLIEAKNSLELKVGKKIETIDESTFIEVLDNQFEENDAIKSMKAKRDALASNIQLVNSATLPQIKIENTYNRFDYKNIDPSYQKGIDEQNSLTVSANMRLYDFGITKSEKQAITMQVQSLNKEIEYKIEEQKNQNNISLARIATIKTKINSARSALKSANSAFATITEKYNNGLVDYISYLDALTFKTNANVSYEVSLNELQIAYALHYYFSGKNLEDFINTGDLK